MMSGRELDRASVLNSWPQRLARISHLIKAKFRFKEQAKIDWLAQFIRPNSTILDIGGNFGVFAKSFARVHGASCTVHAFEPVGYNFGILQAVTRGFANIHIYNLALSDTAGETEIFIPVKEKGRIGPALAHLGQEQNRSYYKEPIQTAMLDELVAAGNINDISFVKCDVEGAELLVFKGAEQTLKQFMPTIFTELDGSYTQRLGYAPEELFTFLIGLGYTARKVRQGDGMFALEAAEQYRESGDYLFAAKEH